MGNVHSAEAQGRAPPSNKLLKPRLGSAAVAALSRSHHAFSPRRDDESDDDDDLSSPAPRLVADPSASHLFGEPYSASPPTGLVPFPSLDADVPLPAAESSPDGRRNSMVSGRQRKERSRMSIFRSRSSSAKPRRDNPERKDTTTAAVAPPPLPPLEGQGVSPPTRHNSTLATRDGSHHELLARDSWNMADRRVSWNYDLSSYEAKRLLNLVHDSPAAIYDEASVVSENKFEVVSEVTWKSSHPPRPESTGGAPISRANSDLSLYTPVRRRSIIQTPGLATRRNTSRGPPLSGSHRYSHPPTPSLSRQASSESLVMRVKSMPPPMPSRLGIAEDVRGPVTPCEGDYQTIGAFKLGTLRIVNGSDSPTSPSPEPDEKRMFKRPDVSETARKESDYFAPKHAPRTESSGKASRRQVDLKIQVDAPAPLPKAPLAAMDMAPPVQSPVAPARSLDMSGSLLQAKNGEEAAAPSGNAVTEIQKNAPSVAEASPSSPLQTTSKVNAMDDMLFEDDPQPEYSPTEVLNLRLDPNAKSEAIKKKPASDAEPSPTAVKSIARSDSGFVSSSPSSGHPHKPLSKTDSGYSSNVSLRSLRLSPKAPLPDDERARTGDDAQQQSLNSPLGDAPSGDLALSSSIFAAAAGKGLIAEREARPPPPPKDNVTASREKPASTHAASNARKSLEKPQASSTAAPESAAKRSSLSSANNGRTWDVVPRSPDSSPLSPRSTTSEASTSAMSSSSGSQKGRLHRLLGRGSSGRSRGGVPAVPRQGKSKLHSQSAKPHTGSKNLALKPQLSRDTLKTILSVGSLEARAADAMHIADAAQDPASLTKSHGYTPSSLGQVSSVADGGSARQPGPMKPVRVLSIPRKPVPIRKDSDHEQDAKGAESKPVEPSAVNTAASDEARSNHAKVRKSLGDGSVDLRVVTTQNDARASMDNKDLYFSPTSRAMSMSSQVSLPSPARDVHMSPSLPSPVMPDLLARKKFDTPPPVSMTTRHQRILRVPPPLRPRSTPPVRAQTMAVSRQASEDAGLGDSSIQYHESLYQPNATTVDVPPAPNSAPLQPRRSLTLEMRPSQSFTARMPDWQVKTDHDTSRRPSMDMRPEDPLHALEFAAADYGRAIQRPLSAQAPSLGRPQQQHQHQQGPPLRHRASYDDRTRRQMQYLPPQQQQQRRPAKPSTDPRWYRQTYDPYVQQQAQLQWQQQQQHHQWQEQQRQQHQWDRWEEQNYWDQSQQWEHQQYGRYPPPYVPRGDYYLRNNSMGSSASGRYGPPHVPYRILHSYNSPAYRNAPIWG